MLVDVLTQIRVVISIPDILTSYAIALLRG
jgi:hypothetical protein